ncbi:type II toxin-antitoxin system HipA family toxin YjjJ [Hydrogenophaga taeniospiralis]|uniref:type II toxin-antitoxin system HipA family toxin YjjJ n=1 Tax=Hydrogenophaga taeniospiralis TaxID=65656 RepID=UPI001CFC3283|nr:type II toxin-antitoxin system HipA family toxin YjjJ [Hydrogenophaga taeniospiralis]MCB4366335.1 type II toxin-antitoxin system HipA family toxin YjjJ [Hydrogenophaga taeniospiralis]
MSPQNPTDSGLLQALRSLGGQAGGAQLRQGLGISQPTLSRLLAPLVAGGQVVAVGAARARRYLLPREVEGVGRQVPIHEVTPQGELRPFGTLYPLAGGGFWMDEADKAHGSSAYHPSLPWFLYDMRPQGFLGRGFVDTHPALQLPANLQHWSDDHILKALVNAGEDLPGNLVVGTAAFDRFLSLPAPQRSRAPVVNAPAVQYPALAAQALGQTLAGSSAGGEQPKFSALREGHPVLVKFSPASESATDQRWRDLLVCEALALHTLADAGISAAHTELIEAEGRVFLESRRFDRTPQGRVGMVSLEVYDRQYIGQGTNWVDTARRSDQAGSERLSAADVTTLCLLDAFGALIANTDRHHGNISLLLRDHRWQLAPAYDMLPMLYAPVAGELVPRDFAAQPPRPSVHTLAVWPQARALATGFWLLVADDARISAGFRAMAQANAALVAGL